MELDHVLVAVADLDTAAAEFESRYGLTSIEGGRHVGWGTANRIVPLGSTYVELVAVVNKSEAAGSAFGRWVAGGRSGAPLGWAVRTDSVDAAAERLGLSVRSGSRPASEGEPLRWRIGGIEEASLEPSLPSFIEWASGAQLPGRAIVRHPSAPTGIARLILVGDPDRITMWLGSHVFPIVVWPGRPAVAGVVISTDAGELVIGSESP